MKGCKTFLESTYKQRFENENTRSYTHINKHVQVHTSTLSPWRRILDREVSCAKTHQRSMDSYNLHASLPKSFITPSQRYTLYKLHSGDSSLAYGSFPDEFIPFSNPVDQERATWRRPAGAQNLRIGVTCQIRGTGLVYLRFILYWFFFFFSSAFGFL